MAIVGTPPTGYQRLLIEAAKSLAPDKALASLDTTARGALGSVVLVASVLTGFGLFTDVSGRFREDPGVIGLPLILAIASAVTAILVLLPWPGKVDVDNLNSLQGRFSSLVLVRGLLVFASLVLLIAAIGSAALGAVTYLSTSGVSEPSISISRQLTGTTTTVSATVKATRAPTGAVADVKVSSADGKTVYHAIQVVGATGDVEITAEIADASASGDLAITFTLSQGTTELLTKDATLAGD